MAPKTAGKKATIVALVKLEVNQKVLMMSKAPIGATNVDSTQYATQQTFFFS